MRRYIDADALKGSFRKQTVNVQEKIKDDADAIIEAICKDIDLAQTVDAVPVTRCAQCKWWWKVNELCTHPKHCHDNVCVHECGKDYYCADGERRTDEQQS